MPLHPLAGKPAPPELLIDPAKLVSLYYKNAPDPSNPAHLVSFGTSGHRGRPADSSFNEAHILAITQAICEYRAAQGITGPLYLGKDSHCVSAPAQHTALEVLAANDVYAIVQGSDGITPTPVISRAILTTPGSDGIIITPSHNPPDDGGIKYNPPNGGPADTTITSAIEARANELLSNGNRDVKRNAHPKANRQDLIAPYVKDLSSVLDMEAIRRSHLRIGVDPLGGASLHYWQLIAETYKLDLTVVNNLLDPAFAFMTVDHDGKIRMDCSSPYAMETLVALRNEYAIAFGNDPDADRHGIVTRSAGLLNSNHYLAVAIDYLLTHRPQWSPQSAVGKTLVSSSMIDRVATAHGRKIREVPVGFKWFVPGLLDASLCFAGEESAGASFLRKNGSVWTTDKDGLILGLLAAEITAVTGRDPGKYYDELTAKHGAFHYARIDAPATGQQKERLKNLRITQTEFAGSPVTATLTAAPGNNAPIGGLKVVTKNGWFAARPSGTEDIMKLYAESSVDDAHLQWIIRDAQALIG